MLSKTELKDELRASKPIGGILEQQGDRSPALDVGNSCRHLGIGEN